MQRHYVGAVLQSVQVVSPPLHHVPPLGRVRGAVVRPPEGVAHGVGWCSMKSSLTPITSLGILVEPGGIEPPTFALRTRRSPS